MIKFALLPLVALAALVPMCSGTVWGHLLLLGIATGIFLGTVSLGNRRPAADESKAIRE